MIQEYSKQRTPCLTMIYMWDKVFDYVLLSLHDPLTICTGEPGMYDPTDISVVTTGDSTIMSSPSIHCQTNNKKRGIDSIDSASNNMMKLGVHMCSVISKGGNVAEKPAPKASDSNVENLSMDDLYRLIA